MPPASKKDCGLVLFDVASSNKEELLSGLIKFSIFKWFMNSKSIYRLILVNSAKTTNDKNYPNIYTTEVDSFDPKQLSQEIRNAQKGKANWLDAILLGIYHLEEAVGLPGLVTLQLIFFTTFDLVNTPMIDQNKVQTIISKLNELKIFLYIIGPNVQLPFAITSYNCVPKCMKELQVDQRNPNLVIAKKIITSVETSVLCNTKIGINLLITFKSSQGSQPWNLPFTFGSKLAIPAVTVKLYRKDISLKLYSPNQRVSVKTLADQQGVTVNESNIVKGIVRHGKMLKIEDELFRTETEKCFEILGFTENRFVPETYLRGEDTFYILPSASGNDGFQVFTHLVNILAETNKYAIVKRVYTNNTKVRYYVLIPNLNYKPKCFTMTGLPYSDFLTPHKCEPATAPKEKIKQDDFYRFFKSLYIDSKDSKAGITLGPNMMLDFRQHKVINSVAKKYLQQDLPSIDNLDVCDYEIAPNNKFLETLKQSWPARTVDTQPKK